jgi:hypothetical protein
MREITAVCQYREKKVSLEMQDLACHMDLEVHQENQDLQDLKVIMEPLDLKVCKVKGDRQEGYQVMMVRMVKMGQEEMTETQDFREYREVLVWKEIREKLVLLALQVLMHRVGKQKEKMERMEVKVRMVSQDLLDKQENQVNQETMAKQ